MITSLDARALLLLIDARGDLDALEEATKTRTLAEGYTFRGCEISIGDHSEDGSSADASIIIDPETARLLLPEIRRVIHERLVQLGAMR